MASQLPQMHDDNQTFMLMQTKWRSILNPILQNTLLNGQQLTAINLIPGKNTVPHNLGRLQVGFFITDIQGQASFMPYRSEPFNSNSLILQAPSEVTVNIWVY